MEQPGARCSVFCTPERGGIIAQVARTKCYWSRREFCNNLQRLEDSVFIPDKRSMDAENPCAGSALRLRTDALIGGKGMNTLALSRRTG